MYDESDIVMVKVNNDTYGPLVQASRHASPCRRACCLCCRRSAELEETELRRKISDCASMTLDTCVSPVRRYALLGKYLELNEDKQRRFCETIN
jgi:hypothetical protein